MTVDLDVAIVGGGVSGLYCAWSLLARAGASRPCVGLFEMSQRLGGRLYTLTPPGAPDLRAELGGMRLLSHHRLALDLAGHLGLPVKPFLMGDEHDLLFLRGVRLTAGDLKATTGPFPYQLSAEEKVRTVEALLARVILFHVPDALHLTPAQWRQTKESLQIEGRPLYEWSFAELIARVLSPEAVEYLHSGFGYVSIDSPQINSADLIENFTNDARAKYLTVADGMQTLPLALARRFEEAGGRLERGTRCQRVDRLRDADGGERIGLLLDRGGEELRVRARHVILAMPKRSLELLDPQSFLFQNDSFRSDMQTVIPIPASKLNLAFREPWWEQFGITSGRSVTDLPIRQCLYFGTEAGRPGVAADNRNSLLTASYCDGPAVLFWEQFTGEVQPDVMFQAEEPVTPDLQAPAGMVAEVQKQLARMHGIDIPTPYWVAFMDWTRDPFGGGWHWWRVGQKSWEVVPRVLRPVADANLYVCGECWSPCQAWVEGALMTAESVLQRHLGLPWPEWLEPSAVLGT